MKIAGGTVARTVERLEPFAFYGILLLWLVPVWTLDFFVTGDGPCHLYNSKLLLDWWHGTYRDFYDPFYYLNTHFEPNWLYNLLTMPLLAWFGPVWADRLFMTLYLVGFALGLRYLVRQINPQALFVSTVGLLFAYHHLLMMGFMNNSLSLVLWFWLAGWWWERRDDHRTGTLLITALLWLSVYAAHPVGLTFAGITVGSLVLGLWFFEYRQSGWTESWQRFTTRIKSLAITLLPTALLFAEFFFRRDWSKETNLPNRMATLENIVRLSPLVTMRSTERDLAIAAGILCWLLLFGAIFQRWRARRGHPADGLLLLIVLSFGFILFPPASFSGGLELHLRLIMIPFLAMLLWIATAVMSFRWRGVGILATIALAIGLMEARWPAHREASDYAREIFSCDPYIGDTATILVLNYDWAGQTPAGQTIANRIWLFGHVDGYLGTTRSAIISDNYEANYAYFPMISRWETVMYSQTDKDGINFDHRPPRADILSYHRRTRQDLDYVLLLSYRDEFRSDGYTQEIFSQLDQAYDKVFTSAQGRAVLYKRRL